MEFETLGHAKDCIDEARKQWLIASAPGVSDADRVLARECANAAFIEYTKHYNLHCAQAYFEQPGETFCDCEKTSLVRELMLQSAARRDMNFIQRFARDTVDFFDSRLAPLVRALSIIGIVFFIGWLAGSWMVTVGQSCASL